MEQIKENTFSPSAKRVQSEIFNRTTTTHVRSQNVVEILESIRTNISVMQTEDLASNFEPQHPFKFGSILPTRENLAKARIPASDNRDTSPLWSTLKAQGNEILTREHYLESVAKTKSLKSITHPNNTGEDESMSNVENIDDDNDNKSQSDASVPNSRPTTAETQDTEIKEESSSESDSNLVSSDTEDHDEELSAITSERIDEDLDMKDMETLRNEISNTQVQDPTCVTGRLSKSQGEILKSSDLDSSLNISVEDLTINPSEDKGSLSEQPKSESYAYAPLPATFSTSLPNMDKLRFKTPRSPRTYTTEGITSSSSKEKFLAFARSVSKEMLANSKIGDGSAAISKNIREAVALINEAAAANQVNNVDSCQYTKAKPNAETEESSRGDEYLTSKANTPKDDFQGPHQGLTNPHLYNSGDTQKDFARDVEIFLKSLGNKNLYGANKKSKYTIKGLHGK